MNNFDLQCEREKIIDKIETYVFNLGFIHDMGGYVFDYEVKNCTIIINFDEPTFVSDTVKYVTEVTARIYTKPGINTIFLCTVKITDIQQINKIINVVCTYLND